MKVRTPEVGSPTSPLNASQEAVAEHYFCYGLDQEELKSAKPLGTDPVAGPPSPLSEAPHPLDDTFEPSLLSRFPMKDTSERTLPSFTHMVRFLLMKKKKT